MFVKVHTRGRRLGDCDGRSVKAALDAIVAGGILPDDNAQIVKKVSFTQEFGEADQTIITIETIAPGAEFNVVFG